MKGKKDSTTFYNAFDQKLIEDYLHDNKRINRAIRFTIQSLPTQSKQILDIGCGIGWSTSELARHNSTAKIIGLDISPILVSAAKKLFGQHKNINYICGDFTESNFPPFNNIDAFVLLDVFEHIHPQDRGALAKFITNRSVSSGARVILSCPTVRHQEWLLKNKPEGLQPIDELIDNIVLEEFAQKLNGKIVHFQEQTIWNDKDYLYCIIQLGQSNDEVLSAKKSVKLEARWSRLLRVNKINPVLVRNFILSRLKRISFFKILIIH